MKTAQVLSCSLQHFSTDYLTNEKLRNVFCSEKAEHGDILTKALDVLTQTLMNPKISLQDNRVIGFIDDLFKIINKNKEKPNFKLCSIIARKLGFNVNANGTRLLIRGILYLYENNHSEFYLEKMYEYLSKKYNIRLSKIKWDIENSVRAANKNSNDKLLHIIFSEYDGRNLAPKYFITISLYELLNRFNSHNYTKDEIENLSYHIAS